MDNYNKSLKNLLDLHAPFKTRTVSFSCWAPWYTCQLRKLKTAGHALEWRATSSGLSVHTMAFKDHQKTYAKSLEDARSHIYSNIINSSPGNSKRLFSTINLLLKPQSQTHTDYSEEQLNKFLSFFKVKIDTIHSHLSSYPAQVILSSVLQLTAPHPLQHFSEVLQSGIEVFITKMKQTTCRLLSHNTDQITPPCHKSSHH